MGPEVIVPFLVFSIPIIAIVGGIMVGVVRQIGRQRMLELAQQERIAAIQRGVDLAQLPPLPPALWGDGDGFLSYLQSERRRAQNLLIAGLITCCFGAGLTTFLYLMLRDEGEPVWAAGFVVLSVGIALLASAAIVWPRRGADSAPRG
jgi:hypothetical protein